MKPYFLLMSVIYCAESTLSLQAGVKATSKLKSRISMEEAERMMAHTTIMSYSTINKKHQIFARDNVGEWVMLLILVALWIMFLMCLFCRNTLNST